MNNMNDYWMVEFKNAWVMLNEKLYLPDGYNYGKEKGIENDILVEMISLKADIEWDTKHGIIFGKFKYYTVKIYGLLGVEGY